MWALTSGKSGPGDLVLRDGESFHRVEMEVGSPHKWRSESWVGTRSWWGKREGGNRLLPQKLLCTLHPLTQPSHQPFLVGFSPAHFGDEAPETQIDQDLVAQRWRAELRMEVGTRTPAPPPSLASWKLLLALRSGGFFGRKAKTCRSQKGLRGCPSSPGQPSSCSLGQRVP